MSQTEHPRGRTPKGSGEENLDTQMQHMRQQAEQHLSEGAVTSGYRANREAILDLMNRALASEWSAFLQYEHHYVMASDIHSSEIREMWREHANEELGHARQINERINQLSGVPANSPQQIVQLTPTPFVAGHDMRDMLKTDLVHERQSIAFYNEIVRTCGFDDNETRVMFEGILSDENEHANELSNLLFQFDGSTGQQIDTLHQQELNGGGQQTRALSR